MQYPVRTGPIDVSLPFSPEQGELQRPDRSRPHNNSRHQISCFVVIACAAASSLLHVENQEAQRPRLRYPKHFQAIIPAGTEVAPYDQAAVATTAIDNKRHLTYPQHNTSPPLVEIPLVPQIPDPTNQRNESPLPRHISVFNVIAVPPSTVATDELPSRPRLPKIQRSRFAFNAIAVDFVEPSFIEGVRARIKLGPRIPLPLVPIDSVPFGHEYVGNIPASPRLPRIHNEGQAIAGAVFVNPPVVQDGITGYQPERARVRLGPRIPLPEGQPSLGSGPVTQEQVTGYQPSSPVLMLGPRLDQPLFPLIHIPNPPSTRGLGGHYAKEKKKPKRPDLPEWSAMIWPSAVERPVEKLDAGTVDAELEEAPPQISEPTRAMVLALSGKIPQLDPQLTAKTMARIAEAQRRILWEMQDEERLIQLGAFDDDE